MSKVPESVRFPLDRKAILSDDRDEMLVYLKKLILSLQRMYTDLADTINQNRDDYDSHTTHPP